MICKKNHFPYFFFLEINAQCILHQAALERELAVLLPQWVASMLTFADFINYVAGFLEMLA